MRSKDINDGVRATVATSIVLRADPCDSIAMDLLRLEPLNSLDEIEELVQAPKPKPQPLPQPDPAPVIAPPSVASSRQPRARRPPNKYIETKENDPPPNAKSATATKKQAPNKRQSAGSGSAPAKQPKAKKTPKTKPQTSTEQPLPSTSPVSFIEPPQPFPFMETGPKVIVLPIYPPIHITLANSQLYPPLLSPDKMCATSSSTDHSPQPGSPTDPSMFASTSHAYDPKRSACKQEPEDELTSTVMQMSAEEVTGTALTICDLFGWQSTMDKREQTYTA